MSKSPLNHNPFGSIGKQMRAGKKNTSQANQFEGALGRIKSLTNTDMPQDPLGLLPDQSVTNQEQTNNAASLATQQAQVAQGTGLNTLTKGPSASSTTQALNAGDYRPMGVSQAFLMKSPLKALDGSQPKYNYENPDQRHNTMSTGAEYVAESLQNAGATIAAAGSKKAKANKEKAELDKKLKNNHIGRPYSNKEEDKEKNIMRGMF
tara:strand:- start:42 stop:662 length:621 start_codon:yes stop_codon:yes gene_type:complete